MVWGLGGYFSDPQQHSSPAHRGLGQPSPSPSDPQISPSPSNPQILLPELGALRTHLQLTGNESTRRGCANSFRAPAAPLPQDLRHNPLLSQIQTSVQASSILTACRRAVPGQGAHRTLPGAVQLAQHLQVGRKLLRERNQCPRSCGAAGVRNVFRVPCLSRRAVLLSIPYTLPLDLAGMKTQQCCHLWIPAISSGKGACVGSWRGARLGQGLPLPLPHPGLYRACRAREQNAPSAKFSLLFVEIRLWVSSWILFVIKSI